MAAIPFPPPITFDEACKIRERANKQLDLRNKRINAEYLNLLFIDRWLNYEISNEELYDNIREVVS